MITGICISDGFHNKPVTEYKFPKYQDQLKKESEEESMQ